MARSRDLNSAGSQFFIMVNEASHLDGEYAAFGKVIEGWKQLMLSLLLNEMVKTNKRSANEKGGSGYKGL